MQSPGVDSAGAFVCFGREVGDARSMSRSPKVAVHIAMALYTNGRPQPTSAAIPHRVTGQYLARNQLGKRPRARLAADISAGKVIVTDFTIKQLANICRVSIPYIAKARQGGRKLQDPVARLLRDWDTATSEQRVAFARIVGVDQVWDAMIAPVISEDRASN
jgi:hypothetical protein